MQFRHSRCRDNTPALTRRAGLAILGWLLILPALALADDPRQIWNGQQPAWLAAVGKLTIPGVKIEQGYARHHVEDCSATLVRHGESRDADIILTAWHCLEYYRDLSRPIVFAINDRDGNPLRRTARRLVDGGGMHADWAIMRLDRALPGELATPIVTTAAASYSITLAGFSGDPGLGNAGAHLTYHANCSIIGEDRSALSTDCIAFKGASGGAVFGVRAKEAQLLGVVSEGDGETVSTYVPITRISDHLDRYLREAPQLP